MILYKLEGLKFEIQAHYTQLEPKLKQILAILYDERRIFDSIFSQPLLASNCHHKLVHNFHRGISSHCPREAHSRQPNILQKCLNVRQKLGTRSLSHTLSHSLILSLSHSFSLSLFHSLTLNMLNNFCFHVYAQNSLSHFHTLDRVVRGCGKKSIAIFGYKQ